ncbi:MAG: hypothetical protein A2X94_04395 [Bdellovibrionales bacterium GWB1_55_8]|nr:MAG: hypothetical protein A2X94_04395 [Bdellovibrionales bacterium GWB1_55_8]
MMQLKPFQKHALEALKSDPAHVLCIAPTGSGKSLIFERRIAENRQRTLLVTPLVALARQQSANVQRHTEGRLRVTLGSGRPSEGPPAEGPGSWIVSPETLIHSGRKHALNAWRPDFLVVDECHCLWEWGENFRPAFAEIPKLVERFGIPRSLWLTATMPMAARMDLRKQLPPLIEIGEFDLPPFLDLQIERVSWRERISKLVNWVQDQEGPGVVFAQTRDSTERLCRVFHAMGESAVAYHAGLSQEERRAIEQSISKADMRVIIATSAFGMGMDHKHLRWVVLAQPPPSLLALTQAIGRAGRDLTQRSRALIFWHEEDFRLLEWTIQGSERRRSDLRDMLDFFKTESCRRNLLRRYFEPLRQTSLKPCGHCDFCLH